jgi:hypothetical protein
MTVPSSTSTTSAFVSDTNPTVCPRGEGVVAQTDLSAGTRGPSNTKKTLIASPREIPYWASVCRCPGDCGIMLMLRLRRLPDHAGRLSGQYLTTPEVLRRCSLAT